MLTTLISGVCAVVAAAAAVAVPSALSGTAVDCPTYVERIERIVEHRPAAAEVLASDLNDGAMARESKACIPIRKLVFQLRHQSGDPCSARFPPPVRPDVQTS